MNIEINGVQITLTPDQLKQIDEQVKKQAVKHPTPEERFWELINGSVIYTEKENPNSVFWMKDGELILELKNSTLWCRWSKVWSIFEQEYSMSYNEIQKLIKEQVEQRFKMSGVTPDKKS